MSEGNRFSWGGQKYRNTRPSYPGELFAWIAQNTPSTNACWDCGAGSGQAARGLSKFFDLVVATDASQEQIDHATPIKGIEYICAPAHKNLGYHEAFDVITAACSIHWFDSREDFFKIADHALKPGGLFCAWTYEWPWTGGRHIDAALRFLKDEVLRDYFSPESALYFNHYRDIKLPFHKVDVPHFNVELANSPEGLFNFLSTWSPVLKYHDAKGLDPLMHIESEIRKAWQEEMPPKQRYLLPLHFACGRKAGPKVI